jgi:hypothetical protein
LKVLKQDISHRRIKVGIFPVTKIPLDFIASQGSPLGEVIVSIFGTDEQEMQTTFLIANGVLKHFRG